MFVSHLTSLLNVHHNKYSESSLVLLISHVRVVSGGVCVGCLVGHCCTNHSILVKILSNTDFSLPINMIKDNTKLGVCEGV